MDYLKYFQNSKYVKGKNDCWNLVQDIFYDEKGIKLPDLPILESQEECESIVKANVRYKIHEKAFEGCLIHYKNGKIEHIGYALNDKQYIHKTFDKVVISEIPQRAIIYEVLND